MVFNPADRNKIVANSFPFTLCDCSLMFVNKFKYVGHVIDNYSSSDDSDINREIKALFTRTNVLSRRFLRCSLAVKVGLFRTYCLCFLYGIVV